MSTSERGNCVLMETAQKWQPLADQRQCDFSKDPKFKAYSGEPEDFLCRRGLGVAFRGAQGC